MNGRTLRSIAVAAGLALVALSKPASAIPVIEVDLDTGVAGTQFFRTVTVGTTFSVDIRILDIGGAPSPVVFDTIILEVGFNDAGPVLGPGPTGPIAGALAGLSPAIDLFGVAATAPGSPLTTGPSAVAAPLSGSGAIGLVFPGTVAVGPGPGASVFTLDFTALTPGTSIIFAAGTPPGSPEVSLLGMGISAGFGPGLITVVPEPASMLIFGSGLAGLALVRRRRARRKA